MSRSTARSNSPSPHSNANHHRKARPPGGYALLALMIMVAVMLISLTAALPNIYQEGQREREQEAIFRGEQYARAIYLFHRTLGRYPTSVKELLNTNGVRYLRQAYRDPLSPNGRWRFVHTTAAGIPIDSWNQTVTVPNAKNTGTNAFGSQTPFANSQNMGMNALGSESASQNSLNAGMNASASAGASENGQKKRKHPPSNCDTSQGFSSASQTGTLLGAFIAGVAPCSNRQSIRVFDHKDHYDEWEFLGANYMTYGIPASSQTPLGQPSQPGQPGTMNQPGFSNSPSSPGFNQPGANSSNLPSGP